MSGHNVDIWYLFVIIACNSHQSCPLLRAAASFTLRCMFSIIFALTFCMSQYMSAGDHTCAAIPCVLEKVHCRRQSFELSWLPEPLFSLSSDCSFSTCATFVALTEGLGTDMVRSCWGRKVRNMSSIWRCITDMDFDSVWVRIEEARSEIVVSEFRDVSGTEMACNPGPKLERRVLKDFRWFIRHHSSVVESAALQKFSNL